MKKIELFEKPRKKISERSYLLQELSDLTGLQFNYVMRMCFAVPSGQTGIEILREIVDMVRSGDTSEIRKERFFYYRAVAVTPPERLKIARTEDFIL